MSSAAGHQPPIDRPARPFQLGAITPTFRHTETLARVLAQLREHGLPLLVIDDGNAAPLAERIAEIAHGAGADLVSRPTNGGKGAAVKAGLRRAASMGWTHAIQVDADGQHDLAVVPELLMLAKAHPHAVVCGVPVFDGSIPKARKFGRELTHALVKLETFSGDISDSMCGLRIYPLEDAVAALRREFIGNRMDFDTEMLVQLYWRGLDVIEYPLRVTYPPGNISNFRMLRDNVRMTAMHARLIVQAPVRAVGRALRRASLNRGAGASA